MRLVQRPEDSELQRIISRYGQVKRRVIDWNLSSLNPDVETSPRWGEVVLLIFDSQGRLAVLREADIEDNTPILPQGEIRPGEPVESTAMRVSLERTGLEVVVEDVPAIHVMRTRFRSWDLERWYFIVRGRVRKREPDVDGEPSYGVEFVEVPLGVPPEWAKYQWYVWVLKDASVVHPHFLLLGQPSLPPEDRTRKGFQ